MASMIAGRSCWMKKWPPGNERCVKAAPVWRPHPFAIASLTLGSARRERQSAPAQAPRHLEREKRPHAVPEETEADAQQRRHRVGNRVGERSEVAEQGLREACLASRELETAQFDTERAQRGRPGGER